ncbi:type II secretion system F family protein [uncultured Thermomonospora sp.]|uniref:type II secretion system F family protein n=1 Tax=uncultured Thermomonospora sp. TaxID=671175 RepID=UPI00259B0C5C|nr:type II secretion system F family protein [uncultured Thermomonospora sp.]
MSAAGMAVICAALAAWVGLSPSAAADRLAGLAGIPRHSPGPALLRRVRALAAAVREKHRAVRLWRGAIIELCDGVAAELHAGRTPEAAFTAAAAVLPAEVSVPLLAARRRSGPAGPPDPGDIPAALERLSARPGAEGLRLLGACWRIGADSGATFATVIADLAAALRDEEAQRREVAAQLAGPRATARLLAGLPLLGLGMAAALGADPLAFLCGTLPGLICLTLGLGLDVLGLWWTNRLARSAEAMR